MFTVLVVFGTRPEGIKMMPVIAALRSVPSFKVVVAVTGQHREMLSQVFDAFQEKPDIDLEIMKPGQTLAGITSDVVSGVTSVIERVRPDLVLVHGDTTTAFATALAAFYAHVKVGHVEAGLRSHDLQQPWPEEFNRVGIDTIASYLFAPTVEAEANLRSEYNQAAKIFVTGNTGIDSVLFIADRLKKDDVYRTRIENRMVKFNGDRRLVLTTAHRRESFGAGIDRICDGLERLAKRPDVQIVYPVHPNPNVQNIVRSRLGGQDNISLIEPLEYADMVHLMLRAHVILTDSGGLQEEGPALGRPVLVMRDVTERPEGISSGAVELVGTDPDRISGAVSALLDDPAVYQKRSRPVFPYGDGTAAIRIRDILLQDLTK